MPRGFPVFYEGGEAGCGERVFVELANDFWWGGHDVGTHFCGLYDVEGIADGGYEDFGVELGEVFVDANDVGDEV